MDWNALGAIGEVLGSVGVLITIVYFGLQIRRMQTSTQISIASGVADRRIQLINQRMEHVELLMKANSGSEVSDIEREKLRGLYDSEASHMWFAFMNFWSIGSSGQVQAINFARFLRKNPGLTIFWQEEHEEDRYRDKPNPVWSSWVESVERELETQRSRYGAD
jgi:hypothetical protein